MTEFAELLKTRIQAVIDEHEASYRSSVRRKTSRNIIIGALVLLTGICLAAYTQPWEPSSLSQNQGYVILIVVGGFACLLAAFEPLWGSQDSLFRKLLPVILGFVEPPRPGDPPLAKHLSDIPSFLIGQGRASGRTVLSGSYRGFAFALLQGAIKHADEGPGFDGAILIFPLEGRQPGIAVACLENDRILRRNAFALPANLVPEEISSGIQLLTGDALSEACREQFQTALCRLRDRWPDREVRVAIAAHTGFIFVPDKQTSVLFTHSLRQRISPDDLLEIRSNVMTMLDAMFELQGVEGEVTLLQD